MGQNHSTTHIYDKWTKCTCTWIDVYRDTELDFDSPDLFGIGDRHPQHESSLPQVGHQITIVVPKVTILESPQLIQVGLVIAPLGDAAGGLGLGDCRSS